MTGLTSQSFELAPKRLELLKQVAPKSSRVGVLQVPGTQPEPVAESNWKELVTAGRSLGMQLQRWDVRGRNDLAAAFSAMARDGANALFVPSTATLNAHLTEIAGLAAKHRLPAIAGPREFAEAGGLLAYSPNVSDLFRRAAGYVDRILKGPGRPTSRWSRRRSSSWS